MFRHANAISRALAQKWDDNGNLVWGKPLKDRIKSYFSEARYLRFEVFNDGSPVDDCFVSLDPEEKDKWAMPVARIRLGYHQRNLEIGRFLSRKGAAVLEALGARDVDWNVSSSPPQNLDAGGCSFGTDPSIAVLNYDCRAHELGNLYVTHGSFMPTGGSVPHTRTIYANAFRVAERIVEALGGPSSRSVDPEAKAVLRIKEKT